jgi:hypothetical protein
MPGGVTFNRQGKMFVIATIQHVGAGEESWGHQTSEVIQLASADGGERFSFQLVSPSDKTTAHWLPNFEKPTGQHAIPDQPGIIYTAGSPGEENTDILSNGVWWFG